MESAGTEPIRVILTGPESTGKSLLSTELAARYGGVCIEEYARNYLMSLGRHYNYEDVCHIARKQIADMEMYRNSEAKILFFDTYLIITKIWFEVVYKRIPSWLDPEIRKSKPALYLLCRPDIPWEPDPLRENGGEMREKLYQQYESELSRMGLKYASISGIGEERIINASNHINRFLKEYE